MKFLFRMFSAHAIGVRDGRASLLKGKVNERVLREVAALCRNLDVPDCEMWINGRNRLSFSPEIPAKAHQRFRNIVLGQGSFS